MRMMSMVRMMRMMGMMRMMMVKKQRQQVKTFSPRRWFVFDRNKRTLVYYADKSEVSNPSKPWLTFQQTADLSIFTRQFKLCLFTFSCCAGQSKGGHLLSLDLGGVRRPPEKPGCKPEGHLHHEDKWQVLIWDFYLHSNSHISSLCLSLKQQDSKATSNKI